MPIRPENKARYPKNWPEISRRIRFERARNRCECTGECGIDHSLEPYNIEYGKRPRPRCSAFNHTPHPYTGSDVVLTVAHLPGREIEDCADSDLKAMCQRCHNKMDAPERRKGIKKRQREQAALGELL